MTPPTTTTMSPAPAAFSSSTSWGTSVLCPAACDDTPTTWTSFSTAAFATSAGVSKRRAEVDVEPEIGERGPHDLGATIVAVLAHLGDEHAGLASLGGGEVGDLGANLVEGGVVRCTPTRTRP